MSQDKLNFPRIERARLTGTLKVEHLKILIVYSRFNAHICEALLEKCLDELIQLGVSDENITVYEVPGALEIPIAVQKHLRMKPFEVTIALGAVIRGETYHFELVANESARGLTNVALAQNQPVINGILTTENEAQAMARLEKARDFARTAVEMAML